MSLNFFGKHLNNKKSLSIEKLKNFETKKILNFVSGSTKSVKINNYKAAKTLTKNINLKVKAF